MPSSSSIASLSSSLSPRAWPSKSRYLPTLSSNSPSALPSAHQPPIGHGDCDEPSAFAREGLQPRAVYAPSKGAHYRWASHSSAQTYPAPTEQHSNLPRLRHPPLLLPNRPHLTGDLQIPDISENLRLPPTFSALLWDSQAVWLALYFCFNLALTLYNKMILFRFPFPYSLTAVHALSGVIGGYALLGSGVFVPATLSARESILLAAFSVLYAFNIVVSNISLQLVTVPFHQVVRAATPVPTILLSVAILGQHPSRARLISLLPVIIGVGLATFGDYHFTRWGFFLTLLGTLLAALKTILTYLLQSPSRSALTGKPIPAELHLPVLHPLDLLLRMSPLAFIQCVIYAHLTGELARVRAYEMNREKALALAYNGAIAFGLNVVSFTANKKVGAVGMTVAANVKQALTILFAVGMFNLTITGTNAIGIGLTLVGGAWYALVERREKVSCGPKK